MQQDYRFRIFSYLYKYAPQTVNIRPLIDEIVKEGIHSTTYFGTQLNKWRNADKCFIWCSDLISLSYKQAPQDTPILARLEPNGIDEYFRLRNQYNIIPTNMKEDEVIQLVILKFLQDNNTDGLSLEGIVDEIFETEDFKRIHIENQFIELRDQYKCISQAGDHLFTLNDRGEKRIQKLQAKKEGEIIEPLTPQEGGIYVGGNFTGVLNTGKMTNKESHLDFNSLHIPTAANTTPATNENKQNAIVSFILKYIWPIIFTVLTGIILLYIEYKSGTFAH